MSEEKKLRQAHNNILADQQIEATKVLWELYESKKTHIKLGAILGLITVVDPVRENEKLISLAEEGVKIATTIGAPKEQSYLLTRKSHFLMCAASMITSRQRNLKLASGVFDWVDFSLEKDKEEYQTLDGQLTKIFEEIGGIEAQVLTMATATEDHRFRGNIFMALGEFYAVKYFTDRMRLASGGKMPSMLANIYFVRRWNLDKFIVLNRENRMRVQDSVERCYMYFEKTITEFQVGRHSSELAHAYYNYAVNLKSLSNGFRKARWCLKQARLHANPNGNVRLLRQITDLEGAVADKNRHIRNYVEELGLS